MSRHLFLTFKLLADVSRAIGSRLNKLVTAVPLVIAIFPSTAWAVQPHGGAEGLVSHELGHVLFAAGIIIILTKTRRHGKEAGWPAFIKFLWLTLVWNILTFSGHWMDINHAQQHFIFSECRKVGFQTEHIIDFYYYFSKLDHLVLIPALLYLMTALFHWSKDTQGVS